MKYFLNVPLALGAGAQALFACFALMSGPWSGWEDGPSRGAMAFIMFEPAALSWLMLLVAAVGAVFTDAFDWSPVVRRGQRRLVVLAASLLIVVTLGVCMAVALGTSPAIASHDSDDFNKIWVAIARPGGIAAPLLAMGWLAWLIDAPPARRHLAPLRRAIGPCHSASRDDARRRHPPGLADTRAKKSPWRSRECPARDQQMIDEREAGNLAELAQINDATPLVTWLRLTDRLQTDDIRNAAVRRLAKRPTLEADLADALQAIVRSADQGRIRGAASSLSFDSVSALRGA